MGLHTNTWTSFRNEQGFNETYEYFTLADLLELIPKRLKNATAFTLRIECLPDKFIVYYDNNSGFCRIREAHFYSTELINALYDLTVWYYSVYLKSVEK